MSIDKLKRVIWRLQEIPGVRENNCRIRESEIRKAIMYEIGTNQVTIDNNLAKLVELKWIKRVAKKNWVIINENTPEDI